MKLFTGEFRENWGREERSFLVTVCETTPYTEACDMKLHDMLKVRKNLAKFCIQLHEVATTSRITNQQNTTSRSTPS
jgi:hypothetical protein